MIEHKLCRPPRGEAIVLALRPTDKPGCATFTKIDLDQPALAFMSRDPDDPTSHTIWIPDCACMHGAARCPRTRMLRRAAHNFGSASVATRPGLAPRAARGRAGRSIR